MLLWGLKALSGRLHEKGARVSLPDPRAPVATAPGATNLAAVSCRSRGGPAGLISGASG